MYGKPEVFNTDQGSQFTSHSFTGALLRHGITISMDGRGRALDNIYAERLWRSVKYEDVYLKGYATLGELFIGMSHYVTFYNESRPHQSLQNHTPARVYASGESGGALIVDRYGKTNKDAIKTASGGPAGGKALKNKLETQAENPTKQGSAAQLYDESTMT